MDIVPFVSELDQQQQQVVAAPWEPVMVVAGPGSGKTRVLVERVVHYVSQGEKSGIVEPVLVVTFTRKATGELLSRLKARLSPLAMEAVTVKTLHGWGCAWLRQQPVLPGGRTQRFKVIDERRTANLFREVLVNLTKENPAIHEYFQFFHAIGSPQGKQPSKQSPINYQALTPFFFRAKNKRWQRPIVPVATYKTPWTTRQAVIEHQFDLIDLVLGLYEAKLCQINGFDFIDLIEVPLRMIDENPRIAEQAANMYRLVVVDEYQDLSAPQYELINRLTSAHRNVTVVGDPDQTIYEWRGAKATIFQDFRQHWTDAGVKCWTYELYNNYRSVPEIVEGFRRLAQWSDDGKTRRLVSVHPPAGPEAVRQVQALAPYRTGSWHRTVEERTKCVDIVKNWVRSGVPPNEIMILGRERKAYSRCGDLPSISDLLTQEKIPHRVLRGQGFFDSRAVQVLLDWLNFLRDPRAPIERPTLAKMLLPWKGIGDKFVQQAYELLLSKRPTDIAGFLEIFDKKNFRRINEEVIRRFRADIGVLLEQPTPRTSPEILLRMIQVLARSGAVEFRLTTQQSNAVEYPLFEEDEYQHLDDSTMSFEDDSAEDDDSDDSPISFALPVLEQIAEEAPAFEEFMERLESLYLDTEDRREDSKPAVLISTVHGVKGMEASRVIVLDMTEPRWPRSDQNGNMSNGGEDQRIAYVACSRAKHELVLCSTIGGKLSPSRYVREVLAGAREYQRNQVRNAS